MTHDIPKLLQVLSGKAVKTPPIWLMRQAGRYLPEYRALRVKASSFLEFCYTPEYAVEVTLQPIRRFEFDAAIMFSDILVVPDALGQKVSFEEGKGPRLAPISDPQTFVQLKPAIDLNHLAPVFETIATLKQRLPKNVPLIGFCGAPWTLACYMVAGQSSPDQAAARLMAYQQPELFRKLMDLLVESSISYLLEQVKAGVDVLQIFDSWAGVLPYGEWRKWSLEPITRIVGGVRAQAPAMPIIVFARGSEMRYEDLVKVQGISCLGMDIGVDPVRARDLTPPHIALQGNIDPLALVAGNETLDQAIDHLLTTCEGHPHILNLGHGIVPQTPPEHVTQLVRRVRG